MNFIKKRRTELQNIINQIDGCCTSDNKTGFTLYSESGVKWATSMKGKKWGQAFEEKARFYAVIDFPEGNYKLKELIERIGLPEREEDEAKSGIRIRRDSPFDSVQIALYHDTFTNFTFDGKIFKDFLGEAVAIIKR